MRLVKRLHIFMLQTFLPLFAMTFFIVLFIVLMVFLWKYIDSLVGKGLQMRVIIELFFYAAVSMVPQALPLGILLASLMTFGNLGEKFELTAIKASGISLIRAMLPLIIFIGCVAVGAFFFQNEILPKAQVKMWTLLFSVRQKSPEVEIPEGVFYTEIPGYNLLVRDKNRETGMLHDVMIYDTSHGDNATILLADSARMAMTSDNQYLYLHMYTGEQFENLREQRTNDRNVPFRRETFFDKQILIPFDANFNRLDEQNMRQQFVGKNIKELHQSIDSISHRVDSIGEIFSAELRRSASPVLPVPDIKMPEQSQGHPDFTARSHRAPVNAIRQSKSQEEDLSPLNMDSLLRSMAPAEAAQMAGMALSVSQQHQSQMEFRSLTIDEEKKSIRRHEIELVKKYTLSVACIIFFFIGAPLGAIIRKGGLGMPVVVSILFFVFYYVIDNSGMKMAKEGRWPVEMGAWLSSIVLAPLGAYVTWKAMNDSSVFDGDRYKRFFRSLLGLRSERYVPMKEVVINDLNPDHGKNLLQTAIVECHRVLGSMPECRNILQSFKLYYLKGIDVSDIHLAADQLDIAVEYLSDSRDKKVLAMLQEIPNLRVLWTYRPTPRRWMAYIMMPLLPLSIPLWLYGLRCLRNLRRDLRRTIYLAARLAANV